MHIPDLAPDLTFPALTARAEDVAFAFEAKRAALGPWIIRKWGWDETVQRDLHAQRYAEKPFFEIRRGEDRLGTLSFHVRADHVRFGEFYLLPAHQRQGIGAHVLGHCLRLADAMQMPVRLEYLLWNPVGGLYRRCGFVETGRSGIHCFMERPVPAEGSPLV